MSNDAVEQIKDRLDIVDIVGQRVALRKAGKSFKGLCPFHDEKTPSFIVFPDSQTFHCFGCHAGGDLFNYVMQQERVEQQRSGPFGPGDAVTHPEWGPGTVQRIEGDVLIVRFDSVGYRSMHGPTVVERDLLAPA
jgi:hypothetical protein